MPCARAGSQWKTFSSAITHDQRRGVERSRSAFTIVATRELLSGFSLRLPSPLLCLGGHLHGALLFLLPQTFVDETADQFGHFQPGSLGHLREPFDLSVSEPNGCPLHRILSIPYRHTCVKNILSLVNQDMSPDRQRRLLPRSALRGLAVSFFAHFERRDPSRSLSLFAFAFREPVPGLYQVSARGRVTTATHYCAVDADPKKPRIAYSAPPRGKLHGNPWTMQGSTYGRPCGSLRLTRVGLRSLNRLRLHSKIKMPP